VRRTDSRPVRCCTLVAKVGSIKVQICLFTMVTMVAQVRLGLFCFGYDKCLNFNLDFGISNMGIVKF
jgi:hypothetical protein